MPSWAATGTSSGPKMTSAAAGDPDHRRGQRVQHLLQRQREGKRLRGATMNSTRSDRVAALTKLCSAARGPSSRNTMPPITSA